jgi:hypothetical protein
VERSLLGFAASAFHLLRRLDLRAPDLKPGDAGVSHTWVELNDDLTDSLSVSLS